MAEILEFEKRPIEKSEDDFLPVSEWEGEDWKIFFEQALTPMAEACGRSPWDIFAEFIKKLWEE